MFLKRSKLQDPQTRSLLFQWERPFRLLYHMSGVLTNIFHQVPNEKATISQPERDGRIQKTESLLNLTPQPFRRNLKQSGMTAYRSSIIPQGLIKVQRFEKYCLGIRKFQKYT